MKNSTISDDELIKSLCVEENKSALIIIFDRHGKYLYYFVLSLLQSPFFRGRVSHPGIQQAITQTLVIKIFESLWDDRHELIHKMASSKNRLKMSEDRSQKYETVRQYLINYARRLVIQVPESFEKNIISEQ